MAKRNALADAIKQNETQRQEATGVFSQASGKIYDIALSQLKPNPHQPRLAIGPKELSDLCTSIEENGLIHPILVAKSAEGYTIIAGHRRAAAFERLGRKAIPAVVKKEVDERDFAAVALAENLQRKALHPIEVGLTLASLLESGLFANQQEIATAIGKNKGTVSKYLALLKLPQNIQKAAREKLSDLEVLVAINRLSASLQQEAFDEITARKLGRKEALEYLKGLKEVEFKAYRYKKREGKVSMAVDLNRFAGAKRKKLEEAIAEVMALLEG